VFKLLATADWFNLKGNSFSNVEVGTALHNMVYDMHNWRDVAKIEWQLRNGGGIFTVLPPEIEHFHGLKTLDASENDFSGVVAHWSCACYLSFLLSHSLPSYRELF
jgi:hypothetical protein